MGFTRAAFGLRGRDDAGRRVMSLSLQLGCGQGHGDWPSRAVTSLGHREVSGCSEGTATLALSLRSEARSPGQRAVGTAAQGVYFNPKLLIPRKRDACLL